ncbi:MAG: hypothetical protein J5858_05625 [Lentisphaeria bacterium]|nr:hypothetical protein [Lentisphaeria bacterium]
MSSEISISSIRTVSVSPQGISIVKHNSGNERAFICGSIVMPSFRKDTELPGIACVVAVMESGHVFMLNMFSFRQYDFPLAEFFNENYNQYKLDQYVVIQTRDDDLETVRFWREMAKRQYRKMDKIYPLIRKITISNDTQAFTPLISYASGNKLHFESPILKNAVGQYDPERPFFDAPNEIQALCLALVFASQRAWSAFESDRLERLN